MTIAASGSFLKKRTKKLLTPLSRALRKGLRQRSQTFFCFFISKKKALLALLPPPTLPLRRVTRLVADDDRLDRRTGYRLGWRLLWDQPQAWAWARLINRRRRSWRDDRAWRRCRVSALFGLLDRVEDVQPCHRKRVGRGRADIRCKGGGHEGGGREGGRRKDGRHVGRPCRCVGGVRPARPPPRRPACAGDGRPGGRAWRAPAPPHPRH